MTKNEPKGLKQLPRPKCAKCNKQKSTINPLERCFECHQRFCFDHLWGGQFKPGMDENEALKAVCDQCRQKLNYQELPKSILSPDTTKDLGGLVPYVMIITNKQKSDQIVGRVLVANQQ